MFDDFDTQRQADEWPQPPEEINPEEYEDWITWCAMNQFLSDEECAHRLAVKDNGFSTR